MIQKAATDDIPALVQLLNSAYRGEDSKRGWTTEAGFISGTIRTDEMQLKEFMDHPDSVFLKYSNEKSEIEGCVFLQKRMRNLYLGMLSVSPARQAKGTGKKIMAAAEDHARQEGCHSIIMRVFSCREELIAWYQRQGYYKTGETQPFENGPYGSSLIPCEFHIMQKDL